MNTQQTTNRPLHELWQIVLDEGAHFNYGICFRIDYLRLTDSLTYNEQLSLREDMKSNKPQNAGALYWWETNLIGNLSRIEFIKERIEKTKP